MLERRDEADLLEVAVVHPVNHHVEGVFERHAKWLVCHHPAEFAPRRLGCVLHDDREGAHEAVTRAERGGEYLEVVGQLLGEMCAAPLDLALDHRPHGKRHAEPQ